MKISIMNKTVAALAALSIGVALCSCEIIKADKPISETTAAVRNVAQVEYRSVPGDFENLPFREIEKWNFGFRKYNSESASFLWSDPNVIRSVSMGENVDEKHLATALYVCCDEYGLTFMGYGAVKDAAENLKKGGNVDDVFFEMFFLPGDSDNPDIVNYQPCGINTIYPYWNYKLSWMKNDRNNRKMFGDMKVDAKYNKNGCVLKVTVPWVIIWDHLPVFCEKADNFWRLSMIRWGGSYGGETWGGNVHSQSKCGLIRMPDFTPEQQTAIMKTTLLALWGIYQNQKGNAAVNPNATQGFNDYRKSIDGLPHTWMNVNEDPVFKADVLIPLIKNADAIGAGIATFDKLPLNEQKAFYKKNAPILANFLYDVDDAYAAYLKTKLMK